MSNDGVRLLTEREGVDLSMYRDSADLPTIGVGHLLTRSELSSGKIWIGHTPVRWRDGITHEQAEAILKADLHYAESAVDRDAWHMESRGIPLTQNQFDALVSFVFNVGAGAYNTSTLRKELLAGNYNAVPHQMKRWNRAGGRVVRGLERRRESEAAQWLA